MINGGFGEFYVNGFLLFFNILIIIQFILKSREREIIFYFYKMVEDSCNKYFREEISM